MPRTPALHTVTRQHQGRPVDIHIRPGSAARPNLLLDLYLSPEHRERISAQTTDLQAAVRYAETLDLFALEHVAGSEARQAQGYVDQDNPTISQLADYYTRVHMVNLNRKPRAIQNAESIMREFELYCRDQRVGRSHQISPLLVEKWKLWLATDRKNVAKTIGQKTDILRACLNAAVHAELLTESPIRRWLKPDVEDAEIEPLEPEELNTLLGAVAKHEPEYANIIHWIAAVGCRPSDARDLRWKQVDTRVGVVHRNQVKTRDLATYPLGDIHRAILDAERARGIKSDYIFTNAAGQPFPRNCLLRALKRAMRESKFPKRMSTNIKSLRHTFGYIMVNIVRCPLPIVRQMMGHSDIRMTMRYVRPGDAQPYIAEYQKLLNIPQVQATQATKAKVTENANENRP